MSTNSSDPQNHSTLHYHTSLNDGTGNNESAAMHSNFTRYVEPQWDERSQTNSMIFLVLVALCLCVMLFKITCWKGSEQESSRRISGIRVASVHGGNKEIKTEEYITNRLVLKHVVKYAAEQESLEDGERLTRPQNLSQSSDFCKSDLAIPDGGEDSDEVDQENDTAVCAICLCEYKVGDQICWSNNRNCRHHFHSACGIAWLAKHSECPVCRSPYLVEPPPNPTGDETTIASAENTSQVETVDENETDPPSTSDTGGRESDTSESSGAPS